MLTLLKRVQSLWSGPTERYSKTDPRTTTTDHEYFEFYARQVVPMVQGPRVLDLGCGEGWLDLEIAKRPDVNLIVAVDRELVHKVRHWKIMRICADVLSHQIIGVYVSGRSKEEVERYDTIVATEFIEHITETDLDALCAKIKPHLRGYFVGCTPERTKPTTNPFHLREYTLGELLAKFSEHFGHVQVWARPWRDSSILFFKAR